MISLPNFICVSFDNCGCGRSDAPWSRYTTDLLAQDALELVQIHLKWTQFHLVGISMGGMIAQHIALRALSDVQSLTLMCTHTGSFGRLCAIKHILSSMLARDTNTQVRRSMKMLFSQKTLEEDKEDVII